MSLRVYLLNGINEVDPSRGKDPRNELPLSSYNTTFLGVFAQTHTCVLKNKILEKTNFQGRHQGLMAMTPGEGEEYCKRKKLETAEPPPDFFGPPRSPKKWEAQGVYSALPPDRAVKEV